MPVAAAFCGSSVGTLLKVMSPVKYPSSRLRLCLNSNPALMLWVPAIFVMVAYALYESSGNGNPVWLGLAKPAMPHRGNSGTASLFRIGMPWIPLPVMKASTASLPPGALSAICRLFR